jgi:hypothetical protein
VGRAFALNSEGVQVPSGLADPMRLRGRASGRQGLSRRGFVTQAAKAIIRAGLITVIGVCCRHFIVVDREQKLFPHFGEAGAAIFAVKQVEYGRHDRTLV